MAKSGEKTAEKRAKRRAPLKIGGARHLVMGLGAAIIMFCGGVLLGGAMERYFEWLSALSDPPPAFSPLGPEAFEKEGLGGEIGVAAQIDSPRSYFIAMGRKEAFVAPLYPPEAETPSNPVTAVLLEPAGAPAEEDFANWVQSVGGVGVIIQFLGKRAAPDETTRARVAEALQAEGLRLSPNAVFIDPHHRSRRAELAPRTFGITLGASVIGLGALLGLVTLRSAERERRRRARQARRQAARAAKEKRKSAKGDAKETGSTPAPAPTPEKAAPEKPETKAPAAAENSAAKSASKGAETAPSSTAGAKPEAAKNEETPVDGKTDAASKATEADARKTEPALKITGVRGD